MKFYDAHIYYDDLRTDFNQLENLNKKYQCEFIISPQCTIQSEPEKSNLMYFLQPYLLSNKFPLVGDDAEAYFFLIILPA